MKNGELESNVGINKTISTRKTAKILEFFMLNKSNENTSFSHNTQ